MRGFRFHTVLTRSVTALALGAVAACSSNEGKVATDDPSTTAVLTIVSAADADALIPPVVTTTQGKQVVDQLFDRLAEPVSPVETGGDRGFRPQLATGWRWSPDSLSIAFAINPAARWHDGTPVRAGDVRFSFALYTDPVVASPQRDVFEGIDSVTVRDSLTAVVWWHARHPEQFFQLAYNLLVLPEHLLASIARDSLGSSAFANHPVGSGRYRFERWSRQQALVLTADQANYRGAPQAQRLVWVVAPDPAAANLRLLAGEADVLESVRGDAYVQARQSSRVRTVEYPSLDYGYLLFNYDRAVSGVPRLFADRTLRVALTQAINREAVVANALDSLGSVALGPFTRATAGADTTMQQLAFDTAAAARALDAHGWRRGADGRRQKGGRELAFDVLFPSTSSTRQRMAVLLQEQFKRIGVTITVTAVEPAVFGARLEEGTFDAALNVWRTDPSPATIRQVWGSPRGGSNGAGIGANFSRYRNATFDARIDSAARDVNPTTRRALFRRAWQTIVDDAAAVWLYEPRNVAAVSRRVTPTDLRADAWWASLSAWRVAPQTPP
jgi:peptide/nickel transport system substrate-binding protein